MKIKLNLSLALIIFLYFISRFLFNDENDVAGEFKLNSKLYINAIVTLFILVTIWLLKKSKVSYKSNGLLKIATIYYLIAIISTAYSNSPLLSLYNGVIGIAYIAASLVISEKLEYYSSLKEKIEKIISFFYLFSFFGILSNLYFYFYFIGIRDFSSYGIPSGFIAMILLYNTFMLLVYNTSLKKIIFAIFLFLLVAMLKSFSAYLAFFIMIIFYFLLKKKYLLFFIFSGIVFFSIFGFVQYLEENIDQVVFNKPAASYLIGSGRFSLYEISLNTYLNNFSILDKIVGVGFMAERSVLIDHDLTWLTDPHNSIVLNFLGLGIIGIIFYFLFAIYPFIFYRNLRTSTLKDMAIYWLSFHIMSLTYGMTISYYLGRPSFILIFSLIFYNVIYREYKSQYHR